MQCYPVNESRTPLHLPPRSLRWFSILSFSSSHNGRSTIIIPPASSFISLPYSLHCPSLATLAIVGLYIAEESDEFERSIIVQSMLWGLGGALSVSTIWGFLEDFAKAPHISSFYVYIFFWIFMGISQPFIRMRYR